MVHMKIESEVDKPEIDAHMRWASSDVRCPGLPIRARLSRGSLTMTHFVEALHHWIWVASGALLMLTLLIQSFDKPLTIVKYFSMALAVIYLFGLALSMIRRRDPLNYKHGIVYEYVPADLSHCRSITFIADSWFGSDRLGGLDERFRYFQRLISNTTRAPILWVLIEKDGVDELVVGYTSIIPTTKSAYDAHAVTRTLSQYDFSDSHLAKPDTGEIENPLYLQAVAIHKARFSACQTRLAIKNMLVHHIADVLRYYVGPEIQVESLENLALYGERFSRGGHQLIESFGGKANGSYSVDKHEFLETTLPNDNHSARSIRGQLSTIIAGAPSNCTRIGTLLG